MFDLTNNILNIERAEYELNKAYKSNPTAWVEHSKYVAKACRIIAEKCEIWTKKKLTFMDFCMILEDMLE